MKFKLNFLIDFLVLIKYLFCFFVIFLYLYDRFIVFFIVNVCFCKIIIVFLFGIVMRICLLNLKYVFYGVLGRGIFCMIDLFLLYIKYFFVELLYSNN